MPLSPQAQLVLDALSDLTIGFGPDVDVVELREKLASLGLAGGRVEEVLHVEDRVIPGPEGSIPVRIYRPSDDPGLPVLVYYHGGGFVIGGLDSHDGVTRAMANRVGCIVVSIDYRLAPEHPFPAAVDDAIAAVRWVHAHAAEIGGDQARVAIGGDSAGGNLTAVVSLLARESGPPLVFQLMVYPMTAHEFESESMRENADGYFLEVEGIRWFHGHYLAGDDTLGSDWRVSPLHAPDVRGLPPALVITAEFDPLRDQGEAYARRLAAAGVPVEHTRYDGMFHGFFGMHDFLEPARDALDEVVTALRRAFAS